MRNYKNEILCARMSHLKVLIINNSNHNKMEFKIIKFILIQHRRNNLCQIIKIFVLIIILMELYNKEV